MSALAQFLAFSGHSVSGSDRAFDREQEPEKKAYFLSLGIRLFAQDGNGLDRETTCLVYSTAVERSNPEIQKAEALGVELVHRSDLLAFIANHTNTIAISGTSGKSTVAGMVYHVLEAGGFSPSLITGANLLSLQATGTLGNAKAGAGDWLVMEADESDGTLIKYHAHTGVILNVEKDHKEVEELIPLFQTFKNQVRNRLILNTNDARCRALASPKDMFFGWDSAEAGEVTDLKLYDWHSTFRMADVDFHVGVPGRHNADNALAAIAVGRSLGISLADCAKGVAAYRGVERRHVLVGQARGITVVDDFAHNPSKIKACLLTVKGEYQKTSSRRRILAVFHPHGFAPMKLLRHEIVSAVLEVLEEQDRIYFPEIFYAGGSADKSLSSRDLTDEINRHKPIAHFFPQKQQVIDAIASEARSGDWIVSMGARDPALREFAEKLFSQVSLPSRSE